MDKEDIIEFRTTWNNEHFLKNRSACVTAKRLIKKSIVIAQARLCRQLKSTENDLILELQTAQHDKQLLTNYRHSNSLAKDLQQRLKSLQNEIDKCNTQMKTVVQQEKEYWKQLEQTIATRTNFHKVTTNKSTPSQPIVATNTTFVTHADKNNENIPPPKLPKIRKKKKCVS